MNLQRLPWETIFSHRRKAMKSRLNLLSGIFLIRQEHYEFISIIPHYLRAEIHEVLLVACCLYGPFQQKGRPSLNVKVRVETPISELNLMIERIEESVLGIIIDEACWNSPSVLFLPQHEKYCIAFQNKHLNSDIS